MEQKHFVIPITPRGKGRPRFRRMGKFLQAYTDKETRDYENTIRDLTGKNAPFKPYEGAIEIETVFYKPKPKSYSKKTTKFTKKPDLDNMSKSLWDAFNKLYWKDDSQVISSISSKRYGEPARIEVKMFAHNPE